MNKQRPSNLAMASMLAFTVSCVGLLIFLWISFGGSLPFNAQGYRFNVEFNQATELADNASVQIAGVPVGRVISVGLDHRTGLTKAVVEIDRQYVPRPANTRAILRQKTLLGETYVQLSAGNPNGPKLRDGATLPQAHVSPTVQLDQIFNSFDPKTRQAFQTWMQQGGIALTNRGAQFNAAFAQLYPFATNVNTVLAVLDRQSAATTTLLSDSGRVFSALAASPSQLQGFVRNTNALFAATSARDTELAATFKAFPGFLAQLRATTDRVAAFSTNTKPLVDELHPAVAQLTPALQKLVTLAPELRTLMNNIGPLTAASKQGLPALSRFLNESKPLLKASTPFAGNLIPVIDYINKYRRELAAFFANSAATTQAHDEVNNKPVHYLRVSNPINPESLTAYAARPSTNRSNPYLIPGGYSQLTQGLPVFGSYLCTSNSLPTPSPALAATHVTAVTPAGLSLEQLVQEYYYTANPNGPPCRAQPPLGSVTTGLTQSFPHLEQLP